MFNIQREVQRIQPLNLNNIVETVGSLTESEKNSIILYNKAIDSLRMGSEDIAIIELKKAVAINPNFLEAMNLLGLCYIITKDYERASQILERVLQIDEKNETANYYLQAVSTSDSARRFSSRSGKLNPKRSAEPVYDVNGKVDSSNVKTSISLNKNKEEVKQSQSRRKSEDELKTVKNNDAGRTKGKSVQEDRIHYNLRKYMTGMIAGIIVASLILLPVLNRMSKQYSDVVTAFKASQSGREVTGATADGFVSKEDFLNLQQENAELKQELEMLNKELGEYITATINEIEQLSAKGDYETAADKLLLLRNYPLDVENRERVNALEGEVINKACFKVSNEGNELFSEGKFMEAVYKLEKVGKYDPNWQYLSGAYLMLGQSYYSLPNGEGREEAKKTFELIIERFPDTENAKYARIFLQDL